MRDELRRAVPGLEIRPDRHFLCSPEEFAAHAAGRRQLRMECFYREMRRKTRMEGFQLPDDSYMGGFDGTSDVLAGYLFRIPIRGTHAHSYVQSFTGIEDLKDRTLPGEDGKVHDFVTMVLEIRAELGFNYTNEGELASFVAYAQAFPRGFLALVDTYDTLKSGVPNFVCVALGLLKLGYKRIGIRLDSGDLSYLSKATRKVFNEMAARTDPDLSKCLIMASNEINKSILISLKQQGHEIDTFGIGTHLVTCDDQPAMGCTGLSTICRGKHLA